MAALFFRGSRRSLMFLWFLFGSFGGSGVQAWGSLGYAATEPAGRRISARMGESRMLPLRPQPLCSALFARKKRQAASEGPSPKKNNSTTSASDESTPYEQHQARILHAQQKVDALLNGPDPPLDLQASLERVKSIAPPPPLPPHPRDLQAEQRVMQLESEIQHAKQQYQQQNGKGLEAAAAKQAEIGQLHVDDCGAVLQVNAQYYRAFSRKSYADMQSLWLHDGTATCIHPSQKVLVGTKAVLSSWKRMLSIPSVDDDTAVSADNQDEQDDPKKNLRAAFVKCWIEPSNVRISVKGATTAVVVCDEHVYARRFVRGQRRQDERVNTLTATNIFRKVAGQWKLTHHHASWHADSRAAQRALSIRAHKFRSAASSSHSSGGTRPLRAHEDSDYENDDDDLDDHHHYSSPEEDDDARTEMDGILGIQKFGPVLGDEEELKDDSDEDGDGKKRIVGRGLIMGSLSDLLGSGLPSNNKDGSNSNGGFLGGVLGPPPMGDSDDSSSVDFPLPPLSVNGKPAPHYRGGDGPPQHHPLQGMEEYDEGYDSQPPPRRQQRQEQQQACIATLRQLHRVGAISPRQKRALLTDIIACAAAQNGQQQPSLVEMAYQLLVCESGAATTNNDEPTENGKNDDDNDVAMEEFADQCRVIAARLLSSSSSSGASSRALMTPRIL